MPLNRIPGDDNLYIGSAFIVGQPKLLGSHNITHILSVLQYTAHEKSQHAEGHNKSIHRTYVDVDDTEEEDLLVHFPRIVRFIDGGLQSRGAPPEAKVDVAIVASDDAGATENDDIEVVETPAGGAVYVHCAMGKSRSATAVIAYLLWKHPVKFRGDGGEARDLQGEAQGNNNSSSSSSSNSRYPAAVAEEAVQRALDLVRQARPVAEPNPGFMRQLALWWRLGCPADTDDAVGRHPAYQRWLYQKDVEESTRIGRAPERLWFRDEARGAAAGDGSGDGGGNVQLRCKKCRQMLAGSPFILPHNQMSAASGGEKPSGCPHYFVEPLSWMRPVLEEGALEGRLVCPNKKCNASIGRYSWQGFKCTCREWVCPAFSLQQSKVDQVQVQDRRAAPGSTAGGAPYNIRLPPGANRRPTKTENL